jgi:hypothetical protein
MQVLYLIWKKYELSHELSHELVAVAADGAPVRSSKQNGVQGKFLSLQIGTSYDVADNLKKVKTLHEFVYS